MPTAAQWFVGINGQQHGPYDENTFRQYMASGHITRDSLVWRAGMANWIRAADVPELATAFAPSPPPLPPRGM
jgi:hypothetical protein